MRKLLYYITLLTLAAVTIGCNVWGAPQKNNKLRPIPALIESSRHNKNALFNSPKYDRFAKVYYLYYLNNIFSITEFTKATEYMAALHKKMHHTGAELILYVDYTEEDARRYQRNRRYGYAANIPKRSRQLNAKCPIVNVYNKQIRDTLFKDHVSPYGSPYTYSYPHLRAIDANGNALAYFMYSDHSVRMSEPNGRAYRPILKSVQKESEWIVDTIMATYPDLVRKATEKEASMTESEEEPEEEDAAPRKSKKKAAKKDKGSKKAKRVSLRKQQKDDEEDEDDADYEEDEEDDEGDDDEDYFDDDDWDE